MELLFTANDLERLCETAKATGARYLIWHKTVPTAEERQQFASVVPEGTTLSCLQKVLPVQTEEDMPQARNGLTIIRVFDLRHSIERQIYPCNC